MEMMLSLVPDNLMNSDDDFSSGVVDESSGVSREGFLASLGTDLSYSSAGSVKL